MRKVARAPGLKMVTVTRPVITQPVTGTVVTALVRICLDLLVFSSFILGIHVTDTLESVSPFFL